VLPFTGAGTMPLLLVGLALIGLGAATLLARAQRDRA
jgi:LPXTG-motif cell wall-anchored protein